ncbi:Tricalbin-2 [Kickxella alabastrina]|uniref:Tricalbin-2 n=1 Tax=Kickxella alabastrina TaxID=61397 RepID=A0ACC1IT27_9FUNG|nr:Tricalbin-2 [Kickxella alabastrina]
MEGTLPQQEQQEQQQQLEQVAVPAQAAEPSSAPSSVPSSVTSSRFRAAAMGALKASKSQSPSPSPLVNAVNAGREVTNEPAPISVSTTANAAAVNDQDQKQEQDQEQSPPTGPLPPPPAAAAQRQSGPLSAEQSSSVAEETVPLREMKSKAIYDIARTKILTKRTLFRLSTETGFIKLRARQAAAASGKSGSPAAAGAAEPGSATAAQAKDGGNGPVRSVAGWKEQGAIDSGKKPAPATSQPSVFDTLSTYIELVDRSGMWRNCAGVFGLMLLTYVLTALNFGLFGLVLAATYGAQWYRNSIIRYRRAVKDDLERAYERATITRSLESVGWMNEFVTRFWLMFEPSLSRMVIDTVDPILAQNAPGFLDSLRLTTFTLGTKAPRINGVRTYSELEDRNQIVMDWHASFTPNDLADVPAVLRENRVNPKVVLTVRVGKGFLGAGMPILVENMVFKGKMQVKLQLGPVFPHVRTADVCFLERPTIDFTLKPVGGDTFGIDIAHIPGLRTFILDMIHATIGPMFYAPNHFTVDVEQLISGAVAKIPTAKGVLIIHVNSARGLPKMDTFGKADPYVRVSTVKHPEIAKRTKTIEKTLAPSWNETLKLLIYSKTDTINLEVFDWNSVGKDEKIGFVSYPMQTLLDQAEAEGITLPIKMGESERGQLSFDMSYYPVSTRTPQAATVDAEGNQLDPSAEAAAMESGEAGEGNSDLDTLVDSNTGLLRLFVRSASNLAMTPALARKLSVRAEAYLDKELVIECPEIKATDAPAWEVGKELFVLDRDTAVIRLVLVDTASDRTVGTLKVKVDDALLHQTGETGSDWYSLDGHVQGKVRLNVKWRPILMDPDVAMGLGQGKRLPGPPIGMVKLTFHEGRGLKNVEAASGSKSDPYMRVMVQNRIVAKTRYIANSLDPIWHETLFIPVHSLGESLALECMDWNRSEKHKPLGESMLKVSRLLGRKAVDEKGETVFEKAAPVEMWAGLRQRNGKVKGEVRFRATFIPAINFDDMLSDAERERGLLDMRINSGGLVLGDEVPLTAGSDSSSDSSSDEEDGNKKKAAAPHLRPGMPVKVGDKRELTSNLPSATAVNTPLGEQGPTTPGGQQQQHRLPESIFSGMTNGGGDSLSQALARYPRLPNIDYKQFKAGVLSVATIGCRGLTRPFAGVFVDVFLNGNSQAPVIETLPSRRRGYEHMWADEFAQVAIAEAKHDSLVFDLRCQPAGSSVIDRENSSSNNRDDDVISIGRAAFSMAELLEKKLVNTPEPFWLPLNAGTGEVLVLMRYDPVEDPQLLPSESIADQGLVRLRIASATNLPAADKSGTSDPYVVALVDGVKVWESQTLKKTLNPHWNQQTEVGIRQRSKTVLTLEVYDWNQIQSHTLLGTTTIPLKDLPINTPVEKDYPLASSKLGNHGSALQLKFQFKPCYVEQHDASGPVLLGVAQTVVKAPVTVIKGGASVVGNVVGGLFGKLGSKKTQLLGGGSSSSKRGGNDDKHESSPTAPYERKLSAAAIQSIATATNMPADHLDESTRGQQDRAADVDAVSLASNNNSPLDNAIGAAVTDSDAALATNTIPMPRLSESLDSFPVSGMLQVTIESAELYESALHSHILGGRKHNVMVTIDLNRKTVHKTRVEKDVSGSPATVTFPHECFSLPVLQGGAPILTVAIKDHSSFRGDKTLVEMEYNVLAELSGQLLETNGAKAASVSKRLGTDAAAVVMTVVFTSNGLSDESVDNMSVAGSTRGRQAGDRHTRRSSAFSRKSLK